MSHTPRVRPANLVLRCYAIKREGVWSAMCIDFSLAAQASSFDDAKRKLNAQIVDYVRDAVTIDHEHASYLLQRRAPFSQLWTYRLLRLRSHVMAVKNASTKLFTQALPVVPCKA